MKKWYVNVCVVDTMQVEAETQEQAEAMALAAFDATANDPQVDDSWEMEETQ